MRIGAAMAVLLLVLAHPAGAGALEGAVVPGAETPARIAVLADPTLLSRDSDSCTNALPIPWRLNRLPVAR